MNRRFLFFFASAAFLCWPTFSPAQSPDRAQEQAPRRAGSVCGEEPRGDASPSLCVPASSDVASASAETKQPAPAALIRLVLSPGTPLRIATDQRTRVGRVGEPIRGHVVETVYAFDEPVIPAGTIALGRVSEIDAVPKLRRARAYASGNFSPFRRYKVEIDRLKLPSGKEIEIHTTVSEGAAEVVHLVSKGKETDKDEDRKGVGSRATEKAKAEVKGRVQEAKDSLHRAEDQIRRPGRMHRLKQFITRQSPYRRQYVTEGTRFNASLNEPLDFGKVTRTQGQLAAIGSKAPSEALLHARLMLEVSSAKATRGNPVVAELTEPLYSADHHLLLPAGTRLIGQVLEAKPARYLHRNGELRVIFEHLEVPGGNVQAVQGSLEGIEVNREAHMKLDEEGGAHATESKSRYLSTGLALAVAVTAAAAHPDVEHGAVDRSGDPAVQAGAGASGFGLAGTLIGLAVKSNAVSIAFSAYGASTSIYSNFLSRGHEVVLPKDAPLEIGLGLARPAAASRQ